MAFWGIEVRPGKPFTHSYDESRGRLRISQASLGDGKGSNKSVLQCNVGDKSPILLCNLIPNVSESCHLELEFEENDDVIFSVLGQRSVHLSGYYLGSGGNARGDDSDESYGEDIAETESEDAENYYDSEDDEYESDFIDDDDIEMFSAPRRKSNVVIKEIEEEEKPANGNADPKVLESEDEDGFPISFSVLKKSTVKKAEACEKSDQMNSDDKKRKVGTVVDDVGLKRKLSEPHIAPESIEKPKKKKKVKSKKALQTDEGDGDEGQLADGKTNLREGDEVDQAEYNDMDEDRPDAVEQEKLPDVKKDDPSSVFPNTTPESNGKRKRIRRKG
ncbi:hypothetical protein J5N97_009417 [Dioscorea zingiberensis]|uniref:peptidylprolyl isomerase n=1 Tax=Dioscorea zingiberensis TaxID=325984 RepID=A0A9D5CYQ7_9LILI|nr:hypothetical protein J5N97_009417 [Dioscorea zingiberensis]